MREYGRLVVICGTMYSGKTEELIRRLRRAEIAQKKVQAFKPKIDNRYLASHIVSHSGWTFAASVVAKSDEILRLLENDTSVVGIDEAQFFDDGLITTIRQLLLTNCSCVVIAGLDLDFRGETFGSMPQLLCLAEEAIKLHAICTVCGLDAYRTQRVVNGKPARADDPVILVGASEFYEPRCYEHYVLPA